MRSRTIVLITLAVFIAAIYYFFSDEKLNPEAQKWIEYYSKPANLDKNIFIEFIALGSDSENAYELAVNRYEDSVKHIKNGFVDDERLITYPEIPGYFDFHENSLFCTFDEEKCFEQLKLNRSKIEPTINLHAQRIKKLISLSELSNFSHINSMATQQDLNQLRFMFNIAAIDTYNAYLDKDHTTVSQNLSSLIHIDRKLMEHSGKGSFFISFIVNVQALYIPIIQHLIASDFNQWQQLRNQLPPLSMEELSNNQMHINMFADGYHSLKFESIANQIEENSHLNRMTAKLRYKENATNNRLYERLQYDLIESPEKSVLLEELTEKGIEREKHYDSWRSISKHMFLIPLMNPRNIVGSILATTIAPRFLDIYDDAIEADLKLYLLNILIELEHNGIERILEKDQYTNPYTGEKPFTENGSLCYQMEEPICLALSIST
ncbi:hypothetical protein [Aliiglaciecola sp. M165]|uniref:hypothetical protein n=1 Tax=Aliiglaciecola sp. M165 TaxID=2593649 RepID=UPI0011811969|nr:hypothetical protein [Aliiglaciecola sp. M165]TRY32622.1 hypothetical protein FM019_07230 [Aliiglaciecola sp. M165]